MGLRIVPGPANPLLAGAVARTLGTALVTCELAARHDQPLLGDLLTRTSPAGHGCAPGVRRAKADRAGVSVISVRSLGPRAALHRTRVLSLWDLRPLERWQLWPRSWG